MTSTFTPDSGDDDLRTLADIEHAYDNPDYLGFGYLNARGQALTGGKADRVTQADTRLLAAANEQGWTTEEFFAWLNSKLGRWYGDGWFGNYGDDAKADRACRDHLHRVIN